MATFVSTSTTLNPPSLGGYNTTTRDNTKGDRFNFWSPHMMQKVLIPL